MKLTSFHKREKWEGGEGRGSMTHTPQTNGRGGGGVSPCQTDDHNPRAYAEGCAKSQLSEGLCSCPLNYDKCNPDNLVHYAYTIGLKLKRHGCCLFAKLGPDVLRLKMSYFIFRGYCMRTPHPHSYSYQRQSATRRKSTPAKHTHKRGSNP